MVRIVSDLKEVADDARSNDLFAQAGGQTLDGIQKSLGDTERDDVRPAAANLRAASELPRENRPRSIQPTSKSWPRSTSWISCCGRSTP